jgi:threonine dehydratase
LITASSGNHGAAFSYLMEKFKCKGTIFLPETASPAKIEALRLYGVDIRLYGDDCIKSELMARKTAKKEGLIFISPYNDAKIVGGQATIGIELSQQLEKIDVIIAPVGGGGLISGIAGFIKSINPDVEIIGCQPQNSAVMYESIKAGKIIFFDSKPTISDGTAGGIEENSITFEPCRDLIDDFILLSESQIKEAVKIFIEKHHMLIEGAAALSVASLTKKKNRFKGKHVVLVISGAKISLEDLRVILH